MTRFNGRRGALRGAVTALLVAGFLGAGSLETRAAAVLGGSYSGTADLGWVHLDGRYPFIVGTSSPGSIEVTTSATGALDARVSLFGAAEPAVGRISSTTKAIKLTLRGKTDEGRIQITATLQGAAFVGTITFLKKTSPCRIEVAAAGPIRTRCQVTLACSPKGAVTGTGTLFCGSGQVPVTVKGSVRKQLVSLTIRGRGASLVVTRAKIVAGVVTATTWSAKGFGTSLKGRRRLTLDPG